MSKKLLALLLALVMIVGSFTSVLAENTTPAEEKKAEEVKTEEKKEEPAKTEEKKDEKSEEKTEEKKEEVKDEALLRAQEVLKKAGIISGYSKDSEDFKAERNVTRAEFASMIVRALNLEASAKASANLPTGFKDVPTNLWANGYIAIAKQQGIINGYPNGTFQPNRQISYQDMATMLTIALGKNALGDVYPAGYIVKAQQLGLFNKVDVPAYTDMATRGNVFKMLYNMITSKEFGERKILKAIVLENSRVEKIAADEVVVEVIKVVQQANWVGANRDKRGDQHKYKLDKDLKLDAEDMLGKVYDITVDKNDKIVEVKLDNSYDYLDGRITSVGPKKFGVKGTKYTAELDERYRSEDERIFRTYLNNRDYKYEDFAVKYEKEYKNTDYYYTRVTVKNSKVVFIDAYKFKDIAPVESVKDGSVWYYDDHRNAAVVRANDLESVVFNTAKGYSVGDLKEIVKDDVIHLYEDYRDYHYTHAIVKKDARIDTELTKTTLLENRQEYAVDKDGKYRFNGADYFRPVYSYEGKEFRVVTSRELLQPIVGRKVKMLVAIDGTLQLIQSDLQWKDGVNAIRRITSSGDVLLVPSKGDTFWAKEDRNTKFYSWLKMDNNKQLNQLFGLNDIVYFEGSGSEKDQAIARMSRILEHIPATYKLVTKTILDNDGKTREIKVSEEQTPNMFRGYKYDAKQKVFFDTTFNFVKAEMTSRFITLDRTAATRAALNNKEKYRYFDNLHAYYLDEHDNLRQINNIERFVADNKENGKLKAIVYTENDLKLLLENYFGIRTYHFLSHSDTIANTVIFTGANNTADADVVFATVVGKDGWTNTVYFRDANDKEFAVNLKDEFDEGLKHVQYGIGDIVKLHILKASGEKDVKEGFVEKVAIAWGAPKLPIKEIRELKEYKIGNDEHKFFDKDTVIFERLAGDYAQVYYENEDEPDNKDADPNVVRVIRFWEDGDPEKPAVVTCELGKEYEDVGQFEVTVKETNKNKFYKINSKTHFFGAYRDADKNLVKTKDYGWAKDGLKSFHDDYYFGTVEVVEDPTNPDYALEVYGLVNTKDAQASNLETAKSLVNGLKLSMLDNSLYAPTNPKTDQKANLEKAIKAIVDAKLEAANLGKKVEASVVVEDLTNPVSAGNEKYVGTTANTDDGNGKATVTLKTTVINPALVENVAKTFHVQTPTEKGDVEKAAKHATNQRIIDKLNEELLGKLNGMLLGNIVPIQYSEQDLQVWLAANTGKNETNFIEEKIKDKINKVVQGQLPVGTTIAIQAIVKNPANNDMYDTTVKVTTGGETDESPKYTFNVEKLY